MVAYLAFLPGLNCVSRTWYYVFHAYRLYRDLGGNTARWKTAVPTTDGETEILDHPDFIKKKKKFPIILFPFAKRKIED